MERAGFPVVICQDIDAWLKTHVAFIIAVAGALYLAQGDNYRLAKMPEVLTLMVRAVGEGFRALRAQGIKVTPLKLRVLFLWLPPIVATMYWKRYLGSERGKFTMARHVRVAVDEMNELAYEWRNSQSRRLVVGATGFVGSRVAQALCARGHQTRLLVRGGRAHPRGSQFEGRVEVVDGDLTRAETLAAACIGIEAVVCTATSMPQCHENGLQRVDHDGVSSLIQAAEKAGAKKFVYTSYSGNVRYDSPLETAKRSCESLLLNSSMLAVILRPSYFMETWLSPALGFDPINSVARIYGSGKERISYVSAHNVTDFAVAAVEKEISIDQVVEIGGPEPLSQLEAVTVFERALRTNLRLEAVPFETLEMQYGSEDALQKTFAALMLSYAKRGHSRGGGSQLGEIRGSLALGRRIRLRVRKSIVEVGMSPVTSHERDSKFWSGSSAYSRRTR